MNRQLTIKLSETAKTAAVRRAAEEGFESVEAYVDALIAEDSAAGTTGWIKTRLEEGLASPNTGELTREKLDRLVNEGIRRAAR